MNTIKTNLLVIGAGPGGYVCAIRAAQAGIDTVIVEQGKSGGTCLNVGCIPSKAIIHVANEFHLISELAYSGSVGEHEHGQSRAHKIGIRTSTPSIALPDTMAWKNSIVARLNTGVDGLLKKAGVKRLSGHARFKDGKTVVVTDNDVATTVQCKNVVIAVGSESVELPGIPFGGSVLSSTSLLNLQTVPESLAVVGGGYIGLELGMSFAKLGSKVTVIESETRILSQYDEELSKPVVNRLEALNVDVFCSSRANAYDEISKQLSFETNSGNQETVHADKVLVTVGRRPCLTDWGLTELQLSCDAGALVINDVCQTSMRGVYAIGDVTGEPMLAHRAMAQGELVAEHLSGENVKWDKQCIPAVCFTDPEIVSVGLSPSDVSANGVDTESVRISHFPFKANGRAMTLQREDGFIRVLASTETNAVLGVQAVGAGVAELSAAFSLAIEMGARVDDIAATVHAHPTLSESFQEACMKAAGHGLHL